MPPGRSIVVGAGADSCTNAPTINKLTAPAPGYLPRPVPRDGKAAKPFKKRTLTNLYNARPQRLSDAHAQLDAAYGWPADVADDAALSRLIRWNRLDST